MKKKKRRREWFALYNNLLVLAFIFILVAGAFVSSIGSSDVDELCSNPLSILFRNLQE